MTVEVPAEPMAAEADLRDRSQRPMRRPLHVAVVTETWPPEVNGVAATVARVVDGLLDRGHRVEVVRPRQPGVDDACGTGLPMVAAAGRAVHVVVRGMRVPRYPDLRLGLPCGRALQRRWTADRPDVVHIATEGPLGWSALQAARRLRVPVVSDFRTNFHAYSRHYALGWLAAPVLAYLRMFHNRTGCTMVPTPAMRDELAAAGFETLRVVARGVDAERFRPGARSDALRADWGARDGSLVALSVGRLAAEKNLGAVLTAFDVLRAVDATARLVVVGDGPCRADLMRRCPEAIFAGQRRGADLAAHYASADVFLFPSLTETFGNVVPEAMASGLAVLAYDRAAARELIRHSDNGLLAPAADEAAFCRLARRLAAERGLAPALGRRARRTALGLSWQRIVEAVEARYVAAIDGASFATARQAGAGRSLGEDLARRPAVGAHGAAGASADAPVLR